MYIYIYVSLKVRSSKRICLRNWNPQLLWAVKNILSKTWPSIIHSSRKRPHCWIRILIIWWAKVCFWPASHKNSNLVACPNPTTLMATCPKVIQHLVTNNHCEDLVFVVPDEPCFYLALSDPTVDILSSINIHWKPFIHLIFSIRYPWAVSHSGF